MTLEGEQKNSDGTPAQWWFNTRSGQVEFGLLSASVKRIGPFASKKEAEDALEIVRKRSEAWSAAEASEND
jgi:hypothetical protein